MLLLALLANASLAVVAQGAADQTIVDQFVPYATLALDDGDRDGVQTCHTVLERDAGGSSSSIAAVYLGPGTGTFLVLVRNAAGTFEIGAQASNSNYIRGTSCEVEAVELDAQAPQEVLVTLSRGSFDESWLFHWQGGVLTNVTPTVALGAFSGSALLYPSIVDVYHDGRRQIITREAIGDGADLGPSCVLYESVNGEWLPRPDVRDTWFVLLNGIDWFEWNVYGGGAPGHYVLRLVNGNADGTGRVAVSSVKVNNVEVMPPGGMTVADEFRDLYLGTGVPVGAPVKVVASGITAASMLTAVLTEVPQ
jgi:hypothetical protein